MRAAQNGESEELVRVIGRWSLAALAINSVLGSGVFGLPATVAGLLGSHSTVGVLIASLAMGIIMACFAEVASRFSAAGGPYLYARASFGKLTGLLVAWLLYLAQAAAPAANVNLFVIYLAEFWPGVSEPWPRFLILSLLVAGLTVINLLGVRQGTIANNVFTIIKILAIASVILAGAAVILKHPTQIERTTQVPLRAWLQATVLVAFLFGGFESALAPMSEAKDPRRDAAFALFATLIGCGAIYLSIQWVVTAVLGSSAGTQRPLAEVARIAMGDHGGAIVALSAMVSVYGYLGAKLLGMPRVTFALAQQGDLPRIFSSVSLKFQTPWFSILLYALVIWILASIGSFAWNVTLSVISRLFYYGAVCLAVIVLRRREGPANFQLPGGYLLPVLGIAVCAVLATQADLRQSKIVGLTVLAAVLHWAWLKQADRARQMSL